MATFNEHYLSWRNRTRPYSRKSMLLAAQQALNAAAAPGLDGLGQMPWLSLLAVKWICQDRMLDHEQGRSITQQEFHDLLNGLWQIPVHQGGTGMPLALRMRQLLRSQVGFQRQITAGFVREAALIGSLDRSDPLRLLFERKAGLSPDAFIDLLFCLFMVIVGGKAQVSLAWFEPIYSLHSVETIRTFFSLMSRDYRELLEFCRSCPDAKRKHPSDYFEFPALARYPFFRDGDSIRCWHPALFNRGAEGLVHSLMSAAGQEYMDRYGRLFEAHVIAEARSLNVPCHGECVLRDWLGHNAKVPELLIEFFGCNVFVEAKAGIFDESVMTAGSAEIVPSKLRAVRKAMEQGWSAALGLRRSVSAPSSIRTATRNYLLVVTNKDLGAANGATIAGMAPEGVFAPADDEALDALPHNHIYVLSIDDFERLVAGTRGPGVDLPTFLENCVTADSAPETSKFFFDQHLSDQKIPASFSRMVTEAYEAATNRIEARLRGM